MENVGGLVCLSQIARLKHLKRCINMNKKKLLLDPSFRTIEEIFHPDDLNRLHDCCDVLWGYDEPISMGEFESVKKDVWAIISPRWRYGDVKDIPNLKAFMEVGGRHPSPQDGLDYDYCFERGIRVLSCAPAFGPMVAEMALGMAIDAAREITLGHSLFQNGEEKYQRDGNKDTRTLYGKRVGLIGMGGLAHSVLNLLAPFGCKLSAFDPWRTESFIKSNNVTPDSLENILSHSDYIFVLAIPSTENKAVIDRSRLELIKKNTVFVLISRAHVVDFDALSDLLHEGRFKAAIDVFPEEPLPLNHKIRQAPNVILSAHRAGSIIGDSNAIGGLVADDIEAMAHGLPPWRMQPAQPEIVVKLPRRERINKPFS